MVDNTLDKLRVISHLTKPEMSLLSLRSAGSSVFKFLTPRHIPEHTPQEYTRNEFTRIFQEFSQRVNYRNPSVLQYAGLVSDILQELESWEIENRRPWAFYVSVAETSSGIAEITYGSHSYELRKLIAMFTFLMVYMDDLASTMPSALADFHRRMILGLPQLDPVLQHVPANLLGFYKFYDPLCANSIIASALEFITGTALEVREEVVNMGQNQAAKNWPYFLRDKTALAPAYGYMIFDASTHPNVADYLQAMPDISKSIALINDVCSFYKEELAGETQNYIHNRARCEDASAFATCADVANDCVALDKQIVKVLKSSSSVDQKAVKAWKSFKTGYIDFHVAVPRYKLSEIMIVN